MTNAVLLVAFITVIIQVPAWAGDMTLNWYRLGSPLLSQPKNGPYADGYCETNAPGSPACGFAWSYEPLINWHDYRPEIAPDSAEGT